MIDAPPVSRAGGLTRGYVVAGGRSSRMGQDKAVLPFGGTTLLGRAVETLRAVTDGVRILSGPTRRYEDFGVPIVVDEVCGAGPIAGLHAALLDAALDGIGRIVWLGVDLPLVTPAVLSGMLHDLDGADAVMARTSRGAEPLCAAFRVVSCRRQLHEALSDGRLKLTSAVGGLSIREATQEDSLFANVNTRLEFEALHSSVASPSQKDGHR